MIFKLTSKRKTD